MIRRIISRLSNLFGKNKFPHRGQGKMAIIDIANTIAQIEGWNVPGSLAQRNNNPGNLRFVGQPNAVMGDGGFAKFPSSDLGFQALDNQISLDASRGLTVSGFINKYAPSSENDTSNYVNLFSSKLGVNPNDSLASLIGDVGSVATNVDNSGGSSVDSSISGSIDWGMIGIVGAVGLLAIILFSSK